MGERVMLNCRPTAMAIPTKTTWRQNRDPLWRGDAAVSLTRPTPTANKSLVRHILYLDGAGRPSPYHSTSEEQAVAQRFAGRDGHIYSTSVRKVREAGVAHISRIQLLGLLKGKGKGEGKWHSAFEVMQARKYVELWQEHLLDYSGIAVPDIDAILAGLYE